MPLPNFNQDNVDAKIVQVKAIPQAERDAIAD